MQSVVSLQMGSVVAESHLVGWAAPSLSTTSSVKRTRLSALCFLASSPLASASLHAQNNENFAYIAPYS
ncbi:hypothetical protein GUJ93_ZPchr0015g6832 [Zizania palustris]|uniref:Uncharacterized protein n=1 Tax=Zizania palustris TaxID=103762 RepID=A0A8J5TGD1_ZIZPA|nr:hypothetical protein GUJ93_ZPchr0015g6832 [Zizania palustris]